MNYTGEYDAARPAIDGQGPHPLGLSRVDSFAVVAHGHAPDGALIVPDPNLLFRGDYKRAGADLVLSNDEREFVIRDYFKGENRAALASPDGAHLSGDLVNALAGHVQYAQAAPGTATAQIIGHVTKLAGSATAIRNGVPVILNNGDDVQKGDVLVTGSDSTLGVTFIDGTVFGLSSNARMALNEMIYDPNGSSNSSLMSLIAGTITFVAGETAKHGDMKIDTPVATMGIRGTAVLTQISFFVPPGGGDPQPRADFQVLVEPDGTTGSYVLFDKLTLLPIGTVNQAGQMIQISGGNVSISNALLSPEVQKLISDVFSLKFSANSDSTRLTTNFTDTITPDSRGLAIGAASGIAGIPTFNFTILPEKQAVLNTGDLFILINPPPVIKSVDVIPASDKASFTIADQVIITDSNPADVLVPYVPGTATIKSVSGPTPPGADLAKLLALDTTTGAINYDPAKFAFLGANQNVIITIEFDSRAGSEVFHKTLSLTITGSNDPAVISGTATGAVKEDGGLTAHGVLLVQDVDLGQGHFQTPASLIGTYGIFTFDPATGAWSYTLNNSAPKVRALAGGEVVHDTLTVKSADGTASQLIDVTVTGTNDAAVISGTATGAVKEDAGLTAHGTLTVQDVDSGEDHFQTPASLAGTYGIFTFDPSTGQWSYSLDNSAAKVQALAGGEVVHDTLTVTSADGTASQLIDVAITGSNDVAVISGTATGAVKEDGKLVACGTLTIQDVDTGDDHFQTPASLAGTYGSFTFDPTTGQWTYTLDNFAAQVQALAGGEVVHDTLTVKSADGTASQLIDVTITGTNDAAVIAGTATGAVKEDDKLVACGTLTIQDVDTGEDHFQTPVSLAGAYGSFTFDPTTGQWTYTLDNFAAKVQALAGGEVVHDTLTVKSADGTASQLIDVTITGTNDAAMISGTAASAVKEDSGLTAYGTLTIQDTDSGEDQFQTPASLAGTYGSFTFDPTTGGWSYTLDNSAAKVQALSGGEVVHDTLTVKSADGTASQLIDVTITGTNDAAAIAGTATGAVKEDGKLVACGTLTIQDVDTGEDHFQTPVSLAGAYGSFTFDPTTGQWSYTLDNFAAKVQALAAAQIVHDTLTVKSADGTASQLIEVTITGTNDAAVISGTATGAVKEDGGLTAHGVLLVQDVDAGEDHFHPPASLAGTYGTFAFDLATGQWSYSLGNSAAKVQALAGDEVVHDTLTVTSADGTASQLIDVTVTGNNDAAVISGTATGAVKEDAGLTAHGTLTVQDVDTGEDHFQTPASLAGTYGIFTFDPTTGQWSYSLDNSTTKVQALAGGEVVHDTLTVKSADGTASQLIDVTITGTNDAAAISGTATGAVKEDGGLTAHGTLLVKDVDTGEDHFQTPASLAGTYGSFTFDPTTGGWSYTLDNAAADVQALAADQVVHDTLTVKSADGTASQLIDITITGSNDAAVISGKLSGNVEIPDDGPGSGNLVDTGKLTDTDVDNAPNTFIAKPAGSITDNGYGTYQLTASGVWTYTLNYANPAVHRLDEGQHLKDSFTVQTVDGTAKLVTVTISDDDPPHLAPAGIAGSEINLGLADSSLQAGSIVTVTIDSLPSGWIVTDAVQSPDGSWSVRTTDPASLTITTPATFEGAALLSITEVVTQQDGTTIGHIVADNVEAYAPGSPIFAYSGDDLLTAANGHDLIVFSQPIGHDLLYNFDPQVDQIDLVGFSVSDFSAVQAHMQDDLSGNVIISLGDGQSITLPGVSSSSLAASNFAFNFEPTFSNIDTMSVADGALLPMGGVMHNTGTILLNSVGHDALLQLIQPGLTLDGGGQILLSDDSGNIISGTSANVGLNNADNTIAGAGQLGNGQLDFTNAGKVDATGSHALNIDTGSNVIHNSGVLEASGTGGLTIASNLDNSGLLWANAANLTAHGTVSGNGTAIIDGRGVLDFEAASSTNVVFGAASNGTLSLGDAFHFSGTISGLNDFDAIELTNFNASSATISYTQNAADTGGTLTISTGAEVARLILIGEYAADSFKFSSDLPNHALITYTHHDVI